MQRDGRKKINGTNGNIPADSFTQRNKVFTTLVIESEISFAGFLDEFFKGSEYFILRAKSAPEALEVIHQFYPDLILLSREINGSNGIKLLPEILMEHPSAAIIMMATQPSFADGVEAIKMGAVEYLERPLNLERLKKAIDDQKTLYELMK